VSGDHNQSLELALVIVVAAAKAGAHGLKLQTYTADMMTIDLREGASAINDAASMWNGKTL
jgi:N-acetylneuraminate synthase